MDVLQTVRRCLIGNNHLPEVISESDQDHSAPFIAYPDLTWTTLKPLDEAEVLHMNRLVHKVLLLLDLTL